jgi:hypothetical protein
VTVPTGLPLLGWVWGSAEVVVAGGCGDDHGVGFVEVFGVDEGDLPSRHFPGMVAAFTSSAAIHIAGASAVGVAGDVVDVADGCAAERIPAGLVAEFDQVGEPAVEAAAAGIPTNNWARAAFGW